MPQDCIDHMRLAHAVPVSIDLALPRFAAKDFQPGPLQSVLIATQEYAASPPSLASQSPCLNLDTLSSGRHGDVEKTLKWGCFWSTTSINLISTFNRR